MPNLKEMKKVHVEVMRFVDVTKYKRKINYM